MHFLAAIIDKLTHHISNIVGKKTIKEHYCTFQKDIFVPSIEIADCQILAIQVEIDVNSTQFDLHLKLISNN